MPLPEIDKPAASLSPLDILAELVNSASGKPFEPNFGHDHACTFREWLLLSPQDQRRVFEAVICQKEGEWPGLFAPLGIPSGALCLEKTLWNADLRLLLGSVSWRVSQAVAIVKANRGSVAISLKRLSHGLRVTERHLGRQFSADLGLPFRSYLQAVRMVNAAEMLLNSCLSVKELAAVFGYSDASNFCNEFSKDFGLSPTRYRQAETVPAHALQQSAAVNRIP